MAIDPLKQFEKFKTEDLLKLRGAKQQFSDPSATDDQKTKASALGDALRKQAGIQAGSEGIASLSQLDEVIAQRNQLETPKAPTVEENLRKQNQAQTDALLQGLKQRISESVAAKQRELGQVSQQFDPLRAQSEVAKSQQLRSALERASVRGDRGGIGRSEALATQTAGEQRLTDIGLAEQNRISDINSEISRLQNEGRFQEAQILASQQEKLSGGLIGEQIRQEGIQQAQAAAELKQQQINDERDFEEFKIRLNAQNDASILQFKNDLEQENTLLDAEIQRARDNNNAAIESQLLDQRAQNDAKLEGIRQSGRVSLEAQRQAGRQSDIRLKDELEAAREQEESVTTELPIKTITDSIENQLERKIQDATDRQSISERELGTSPISQTDQKNIVLEQLVSNPEWFGQDVNKLTQVLSLYGISAQELADYEDVRERALQDRPFE